MPWRRRAPACLLAALIALPASAVRAGDDKDQDRVRDAVRAGEVMPFDALRERLRRSHPGDVLELELERENERWIYEVKLLQPDGRIVKLEVDARSGEVLRERQGKRRH
ncbi:MAG TPA: PepSY domain-containing protein [Burkholderiaceae bacterium]|nr:PepSY domain-containing protein [Burkholderiaceae bacterium]